MEIILLVEDDSDARAMYSEALSEKGYHVVPATQGAEGVHLARKLNPYLIMMDLRMPVMDGLSAVHYLKSDQRTSGIPVWGISAYLSDLDPADPRVSGFERLLPKPLEPSDLVAEVEDRLGPPPRTVRA